MWTNKLLSRESKFLFKHHFSLYFKIRAEKIHAAKSLAFSRVNFLFRRDKNHYNLTSKVKKICQQILKKFNDPIQFKIFEL